MINVTLKSLTASNFAPFADTVEFSTKIDNGKKEFPENTFSIGDESFNRVSYIYGANGAGKTFFCKVLLEIQRLLIWSPFSLGNNSALLTHPLFKDLDKQVKPFLFDESYSSKPTIFSIAIVLDENTYHYEFSVKGKKILHERLTKKYRRTEILLERKSPSSRDIIVRSDFKGFDLYKHSVKEEALCLAIAHTFANPLATRILEAIQKISVVNMTAPNAPLLDPKKSFSEKRLERYVNVLRKASPPLRKLHVDVNEEDVKQNIEFDDFENREIIAKKTSLTVTAQHSCYSDGVSEDAEVINFFSDESMGTVKLFTILPHLYDALECGGVLILDEIDNGFHLSLAKDIIRLFLDPESNPHNAQLICTTHQPLLVGDSTRRDQVWVINKDEIGKSRIHRFSDISTSRSKINFTNRLLENAFGCNPEPFFENSR